MLLRGLVALFVGAALTSLVSASSPPSPQAKEAFSVFWREAECSGLINEVLAKGTVEERESYVAFLELRRRGVIEPFDRQWCFDRGIPPVQKTKEKSL